MLRFLLIFNISNSNLLRVSILIFVIFRLLLLLFEMEFFAIYNFKLYHSNNKYHELIIEITILSFGIVFIIHSIYYSLLLNTVHFCRSIII